ncbi:hypothetical protein QBC35DRAFT_451753 [Podospora australis]|uniref:DUF1993 domain-containing protein n=1 Tax=Podospora australis TaxID=1536484 RepID=A0AAN7AII9_9PEZI|nr:hypothetical protein QBC35DRAFT_451753 [Podospora australis]
MTAPITVFDVSINLHLRGLRTVHALLTKASSHPAAATLPSAKFHQDTASLAFHVKSCTNLAASGFALLTGTEEESAVWEEKKTLEELIAQVDKTIAKLEGGGGATKPMSTDLEGIEGKELTVTIPNFMFHLGMVYSVLRSQGVEVGKLDYLMPFMAGVAPGF